MIMKSLFPTSLVTVALLLQTASSSRPYSTWMADSVIARAQPLGKDSNGKILMIYEDGVFERALEFVYNATGNATYYNYLKQGVDNIVGPDGTLLDYDLEYYTLDDIRLGPEFIYLYIKTGEEKYKKAADKLRSQLQTHPRNSKGGFWHRSTYPNQMWLDGLYMQAPFYAQYTAFFDPHNTTAYDDIVNQFNLIETNTRNSTSGLLVHGYDESKIAVWANNATGASPEVWGRALGWYLMALVDVLDYLPASHSGTAILKSYFSRVAVAVKNSIDPATNGWWLVMSQPGRPGNYIESSGSAMFVCAMLKGIRMGYISREEFFPAVEKSFKSLAQTFAVDNGKGLLDWEGTVKVGSLGGKGDYEYYISVAKRQNDLKGIGPFVFAAVEYELAMSGRAA